MEPVPLCERKRMARPSVAALHKTNRVKTLVSHWQTFDASDIQNSPKVLREALSTITNSPKNSPKMTGKRRRESINTASPKPFKLKESSRRQSCSGSPSTSPLKRRKLTNTKEKIISSPLHKKTPTKKKLNILYDNNGTSSPSVPKSPKQLIDEQKEKDRLSRAREALKEIYTTEQTYWKNLLQMQSVFYFGSQSILQPKHLKSIFGNAGNILLHSQTLLLSLRQIEMDLDTPQDSLSAGDVRAAGLRIASTMKEILVSIIIIKK